MLHPLTTKIVDAPGACQVCSFSKESIDKIIVSWLEDKAKRLLIPPCTYSKMIWDILGLPEKKSLEEELIAYLAKEPQPPCGAGFFKWYASSCLDFLKSKGVKIDD